MLSRAERLTAVMQLAHAAYHVGRGRKLRKYLADGKIIVPLAASAPKKPENDAAVESLPHKVWRFEPPETGMPVCLFVCYTPDGRIWPHVSAYMRRLRDLGIHVMLIAAVTRPDLIVEDPGPDCAGGVIAKANGGFDFACWALALKLYPQLWGASCLVLANDSVYGPFKSFESAVRRILNGPADFYGLTESAETRLHFQSYFLALRANALASPAMRRFWADVRVLERKYDVVAAYETQLTAIVRGAGLKAEALFPIAPPPGHGDNPTLFHWRRLIDEGFPFIKTHLLRDNFTRQNLSGWRHLLADNGFNPDLAALHLGAIHPGAAALRVE